jgi:2-methylisocitrate lyase-like PEP mutase family enzyme
MTATSLKDRLARGPSVLAPGIYDALSALLVEQAGFEAAYVSGAAVAYTQLGRPDVGLVTLSQVIDVVARLRDRVSLPLIVDIDTGFGNALNAAHTVRQVERAGASAVQIEDQTAPKRCGHLAGKDLVPVGEMVGKVRAALDARTDARTLVIARTDAVAVEGFERALDRAETYVEAGADVLFVEAPQSLDQMRAITARFAGRVPCLANMVEGGRTPLMTQAQLDELGFRLVITPGAMVRAYTFMAQEFLRLLKANGTTALTRDRMLDFAQINAVLGLPDLMAQAADYDGAAQTGGASVTPLGASRGNPAG